MKNLSNIVARFYEENQDVIEKAWEDHLSNGEWGSGEDTIKITDDMFWQFVEEMMYQGKVA